MICSTCSHRLESVAAGGPRYGERLVYWCPRCGTLAEWDGAAKRTDSEPLLLERARELRDADGALSGPGHVLWDRLGLERCVQRPGERRAA